MKAYACKSNLRLSQRKEIIKVREWIPHIGVLTKVIPFLLFLDMVPSSSVDITLAMRGQPKRLSRKYLRRNDGNDIVYVLICFIAEMFSALSAVFLFGRAFSCARLVVHHLVVCLVLESLITQVRELRQTTTAPATGTSLNKRFKGQNNSCAYFVTVVCQTTTWNDLVLRILEVLDHDSKYFGFRYGIDRLHYIFSLSRILYRFSPWTGLVTTKFASKI